MELNIESCSLQEACASLGETEESFIELRNRLHDWLKLQPHLPQDVPMKVLEHFILGTKMSLEQAKQKLDMFYTMRRLVPEIFADRDPRASSLARSNKMIQVVYLPKLTHEKYRVCVYRPMVDDYSDLNAYDCVKYILMMEEILMTDDESRSLGCIYIIDHSKTTFGLVTKYTMSIIKKSEVTLTEAYAQRIKAFYHLNAAPVTDALISLAKRVMKPKLAARIHVLNKENYELLYQHVPKAILPVEYGGDERSMDDLVELWHKRVDDKRDWFLEQEKILVDEKLRPGPAVDSDNIFGFAGSFRKLDVD